MVNLKILEEKLKLYELQVESKIVSKESMTDKIAKIQEEIDNLQEEDKLELQVMLNKIRHALDIHNPEEIINYGTEGNYVQ